MKALNFTRPNASQIIIFSIVFITFFIIRLLMPYLQFGWLQNLIAKITAFFDWFTFITLSPIFAYFVKVIIGHQKGIISNELTITKLHFIARIAPIIGCLGTTFGLIISTHSLEKVDINQINQSQSGVFSGTSTALISTLIGLGISVLSLIYLHAFLKEAENETS